MGRSKVRSRMILVWAMYTHTLIYIGVMYFLWSLKRAKFKIFLDSEKIFTTRKSVYFGSHFFVRVLFSELLLALDRSMVGL